jgi:hypothetical protein
LPDEHACRCANDAVDATLRELHEVRQRLTDEIRASDDTEAARVDKLLAGGDARPGRQPD